ncbi:MAG: EboA family metabolite traffic protein [SAR324 cluster bacterium]|nr:EboA family metabolite traffic protein [SAR324 cluster bacterium]
MLSEAYPIDPEAVKSFLYSVLSCRIESKAIDWLDTKRIQIADGNKASTFFMAFSALPRFVGKADLPWTQEELRTAENLKTGWFPQDWSSDQAARALLILSLPFEDREYYLKTLQQLFEAADVAELVALYQCLPLLAYPKDHILRAAEGIRSNMSSVFDAVALRNPYPSEYLEEEAWNQIILKAVFIGRPLNPIIGLEERANPELARILTDYVHERWSAGRTVSPEIWRLIGPFAGLANLEDLSTVFSAKQALMQQAAALALFHCPLPQARKLLESQPGLLTAIEKGSISWDFITEQWQMNQES